MAQFAPIRIARAPDPSLPVVSPLQADSVADSLGEPNANRSVNPRSAGVGEPGVFDPGLLPIPEHPGRQPPKPENSLPKPAQPDRHKYLGQPFPARDRADLPIPGRPGLTLGPSSDEEPEAPEDGAEEEAEAEEEEAPGLLAFLPHEIGSISATYLYTGECFALGRGGFNQADGFKYRGLADLVLSLDTEKAGLWSGGEVFVYGMSAHGRTLSPGNIGDWQLYSNIDTSPLPEITRVGEAYYSHQWLDGDLWAKAGLIDTNIDFAISELGASFLNSSFVMAPTVPLTTWPLQRAGGAVFGKLTERLTAGFAVSDAGVNLGQWGFDSVGHLGALTLYQLEWKGELFASRLPNTTRAGGFYLNGQFNEIEGPGTFADNYGLWVVSDQLLTRENGDPDTDQGLAAFVQFSWAPGDRNQAQEYYGGGVVYKGLLAGRDEDLVGVGVANILFSPRLRTAPAPLSYETALELFYKVQINPHMMVQPDLVYISNPGGNGNDALAAGFRFQVAF